MATRTLPRRNALLAEKSADAIRRQLQRLVRIQAGSHWIVSCYLKVEPRDRVRGKYLIKLKNRMREVLETLPAEGLTREEMEEVRADLDRILELVRSPDALPPTKGLAIFACRPLKLFEAIPLPRVYRSRLLVARTPLVRELAALEDEVGRLLAVMVDRAGATIYEVTAFEARRLAHLASAHRRGGRYHFDRHGAPGVGEYRYHTRVKHERDQLLADVATRLFDLDRQQPVRGIVLGSTGSEAESLRKFLHPYLAGKVMGVIRGSTKGAGPSEVHRLVLEAREDYERRLERHQVAEMLLGQGSGWAVNGIAPTLEALSNGQVRTLLVRADAGVPGFRCAATGRLTLNARDCRGLGNAIPVPDVIDDAIEEALRQRIDLDVVFEPDAAETINGMAALLRFRSPGR
jgi:peptide chain release factor subunit 1